jgi:hypothetical protein
LPVLEVVELYYRLGELAFLSSIPFCGEPSHVSPAFETILTGR